MSSYHQISETRTLAETIGLATIDIMKLHDEMFDLCATIAAQFPSTYEDIPKYQQAYYAREALRDARRTLDAPLDRLNPTLRTVAVPVTIGKQTRSNRSSSKRVRLGNATVRLQGIVVALTNAKEHKLRDDLADNLIALEAVEFPQTYG